MQAEIPPEQAFELRVVFLKELDARYREARVAYDRLLKQPTDVEACHKIRDFFHRIAGTAHVVGLPILGHLAMICETVGDVTLDPAAADPSKSVGMFTEGLAAVASVLESPGSTPFERPKATSTTAAGLVQPGPAGEGRVLSKILVVDDDPFSANLIDGCLRSAGFMSFYSCEPHAALKLIFEELPDLIILDVVMPGLDGFDLCRQVREHPALQFTPVIFVTRKGDLEQRVRGLAVGGNDYIAKPFEPQELVARVRAHLQRLAELRDMATRDGLTRCYNHKYFKARSEQEVARAHRHKLELALAMLDIDHFKSINDNHGHPAGDSVLVHLSNLMLASVRSTDVVARYGGEEFGIIFIQAGIPEAEIITNRLRERIASHRFAFPGPSDANEIVRVPVTVSIGVASLAAGDSMQQLIRKADEALYAAKQAGRNQVRIAAQPSK